MSDTILLLAVRVRVEIMEFLFCLFLFFFSNLLPNSWNFSEPIIIIGLRERHCQWRIGGGDCGGRYALMTVGLPWTAVGHVTCGEHL